MKFSHFLLYLLNFSISVAFSQKINNNDFHENYRKVIEIPNDHFFIIETIYDENFEIYYGKCFIINDQGNLVNQYIHYNEGENVSLQTAFFLNEKIYLFGLLTSEENFYIIEIVLNQNLGIIETKKYSLQENSRIGYLNTIIDSDSNFVHTGYFRDNFNMFLFKNSMNGDSLDTKIFTIPFQFAYQLHESYDHSKFYLMLDGYISNMAYGGILELNKQFIPQNFNYIPYHVNKVSSSIYLNDSLFIVSGLIYENFNKLYIVKTNCTGILLESDTFFKDNNLQEFPAFSPGISLYNNNLYIGATSNMDYTNPNLSSNDSWFHLIKMDENLNVFWEKWYGGDAYYSLNSVLATSDGGCLMVGTKYPHGIGNQFIQGHYIKVDSNGDVQWTQDIEIPELSYKVYPNPTQSVFNIENSELNIQSIELYDISGRYLKSIQDCNKSTISIDLTPFSNGIYFAKIKSTKGVRTEKVVKN